MPNIVHGLWGMRKQFIRYFFVGVTSVAFDIATLIFFTEYFGLRPVVSLVLNQGILLTYNFTLNKYWSFKNKAMPHRQIVRYLVLAAWNYLFSIGAMYLLHERYGFDYKLVRIGSIALMVGWNFFAYRFWVYRDEAGVSTATVV